MLYHEETLHNAHTMYWVFHESLKTSSDYYLNVVNCSSFKTETIPVL